MAIELWIDKSLEQWVRARDIIITTVIKFKISVDRSSPYGKSFSIRPTSVEITNLKVLANETEMEMEQMMIQSAANIHLEEAK